MQASVPPVKLKDSAHVLVVLLGAIGDVARGLSVIAALKAQAPQVQVTWVVEPKCEPLVRMCPHVDRVLVFDRLGGVSALWNIARTLWNLDFDVTLDLQRHLKSGFLSWCSRAPIRIGFNPFEAKEGNWLFNNRYIGYGGMQRAKGELYENFIAMLGLVPGSRSSDLAPERLKIGADQAPTNEHESVVLVMGSSWQSKDWPLEGYQRLLQRILADTKFPVTLVGDKSQVTAAEKLITFANSPRVTSSVGKTTLVQLVEILQTALVVVGPDSGPGHIAASLGIPTVSIFGPTSPERTAPRGSHALVVQANIGCAPCYRRVCPGLNKLCMRLIDANHVFAKIQQALAR